jgi:hypothetical protein
MEDAFQRPGHSAPSDSPDLVKSPVSTPTSYICHLAPKPDRKVGAGKGALLYVEVFALSIRSKDSIT